MSAPRVPLRLCAFVTLTIAVFLAALSAGRGTSHVLGAGDAVELAGGGVHTCAVTESSAVRCWGWNFYGQVGDGTTQSRFAPVEVCADADCVAPLTGIAAIGAGDLHSCAVDLAGGVRCWGRNFYGEVGDDTTTQRSTPTWVCAPVAEAEDCGVLSGIVAVAAGSAHTCALTSASGVLCWGDNAYGQLGTASTTASLRPVSVCEADSAGQDCAAISGIVAISAGSAHNCALTDAGDTLCWGDNSFGQLGDGRACGTTCAAPVRVDISETVALSAGSAHTCAMMADGAVLCWGENSSGQLGDGTDIGRTRPTDVCIAGTSVTCARGLPDAGAVAISAGHSHTCALAPNGTAWCWGSNSAWQLADGTTNPSFIPIRVLGITNALELAAAGSHTCVVVRAGGVRCWGFNGDGRLGAGVLGIFLTPVDVAGFSGKPPTPTNTRSPTATPTLPPGTTPTPTSEPLLGDADCNGSVTAVDAALMLQRIAALLGSLPCPARADVNGDGSVTAVDVALVLQVVAGLL